jgi:hypothetical protein
VKILGKVENLVCRILRSFSTGDENGFDVHDEQGKCMFTYTKPHMATLECKLAMCISRLVEFELLLELKFEQKKGTSLVKLVSARTGRLSVPVIYFDI